MALSLPERMAVADLAKALYNFLPGSGNANTAFPIAAAKVGLSEAWPQIGVSKEPGIVAMLTWTLENKRGRLSALMEEIVSQSVTYRRRNPLSREEVDEVNRHLLRLQIKIPPLHDPAFLDGLPRRAANSADASPAAQTAVAAEEYARLKAALLKLVPMEAHARGYAFEQFLTDLFAVFNLAPRGSFRNTGEQIDGSFMLHHDTYLIEARWRRKPADAADLRAFSGKVADKAAWSRGLFISDSGFSEDCWATFGSGKPLICMDGLDLHDALDRKLALDTVLATKVRRAVETGKPFIRVRELF
ncbi:MAG: restriction endonuclease [Pseudomonadota bacterium]|nr:restriction endonuclease [Pseudomonadota bacterium]